jgi:Kdo2-lipid IVA lauroyltransferase/acyltransferase
MWFSYIAVRGVVELFRFIPFWMVYGLADFLYFIFYRVIGYRRKVVLDNLRRCFPEATPAEITALVSQSYRNLADVTLESLKGTTTSLDELQRRVQYPNIEIINRYLRQGIPVIITSGHLGNWEWLVPTIGLSLEGIALGIYKPLSNPHTDAYIRRTRNRGNMHLCSIKNVSAEMQRLAGQPVGLILGSDQSPSNPNRAHWVPFFGHDTAFLPGAEIFARRYQAPVVQLIIHRKRRGYYEAYCTELCTPPYEQVPETDITRQYAARFEADIREQPGNWLWTHKRWKLKKPVLEKAANGADN